MQELDENMQNLKTKVEYLSGQENDINSEISSTAERWPRRRPKKQVEVWLADVQRFKDNVQRLKQEVIEERNVRDVILCGRLGKHIMDKVQEAANLQEKGKAFLVDDFPTDGLLIPPTKDFFESTEARNVERVWECLVNDDVRQIGVYGMGGIGKTTIMKHIHNMLLEETDN